MHLIALCAVCCAVRHACMLLAVVSALNRVKLYRARIIQLSHVLKSPHAVDRRQDKRGQGVGPCQFQLFNVIIKQSYYKIFLEVGRLQVAY